MIVGLGKAIRKQMRWFGPKKIERFEFLGV